VFGNNLNTVDDDDFLEGMRAINPASGIPYTAEFRDGRSPQDREHSVNVAGAKNWKLGGHTLSLGGLAWFRSGEHWGNRPRFDITTAIVPNIQGTIITSRYIEPRDANKLPDTMTLNLSGGWTFPIVKSLEGMLRAELANVTDEQEVIAVNLANGRVIQARSSFQNPRELRLLAGVKF
jgi:outer membrane receptor protein involved in Fe transport